MNQSKGPEEMKLDPVSLIPSTSPAPAKKRSATTKKKPTLMSLPYELLLDCLGRVSKLYYPTLSLVSKTFRSLLASSDLYKVRSLSGHTESSLYVCLRCYYESVWFTLCLKPGKKKEYALARVPIPYTPATFVSDLVVVGSSIYNIARSFSAKPAKVSILDCQSNIWRQAPTMQVGLISFTPTVLDHKIYVAGYSKNGNSIEVFDTKTEIWDPEPSPCSHGIYKKTICIGGKLYVVHSIGGGCVAAYNSKEGRWDMVEWRSLPASLISNSYCEIDNVLYSVISGVIGWCDTEFRLWRSLKGLVGLPEFPPECVRTCVRLADYGGKMAVFWNEKSAFYNDIGTLMIWCAVIALERRESCEIWGQVEWCGHVLTSSYDLLKVLPVTL